jgi:hypothetical protein
MSDRVEAASTSATRELREIGWLKDLVRFTVVLRDFVENHSSRWHVDSNCKRFCSEHHFYQTLREAFLHSLFETGDKTRMMDADTCF